MTKHYSDKTKESPKKVEPSKAALRMRKYREKKKQLKEKLAVKQSELMRATAVEANKNYVRKPRSKYLLRTLVNKFLKLRKDEERKNLLKNNLCVWTTVSFVQGDGTTASTKPLPPNKLNCLDSEKYREWRIIYVKPPERNIKLPTYHHLFTIKYSLIPNAGYGLFAARNYNKNEPLGVFFGEIKNNNDEYSFYAMRMSENSIWDPEGGVDSDSPVYFGLHFANDPKGPRQISSDKTNFCVSDHPEGAAFATRDIKVGEELYLDYQKYK